MTPQELAEAQARDHAIEFELEDWPRNETNGEVEMPLLWWPEADQA